MKNIITIDKYRLGGFSGTCTIDNLTPEQLMSLGLYHLILYPDKQITLDVEGSYEVEQYDYPDYLALSLFDVSVGYQGKFIFLSEENYNHNALLNDITNNYGPKIEQDIIDSYPEDRFDR